MTQTASTPDDAINPPPANDLASQMASRIAEAIIGLFDMVLQERRDHYAARPETRPGLQDLPKLIEGCSRNNGLISGGASLVPGPLGMLTVIPEIGLVTRNQLAMIYEIGVAHGQEKVITKELLAAVLAAATGASLGALVTIQNPYACESL